jgi:hypothetical protein
LKVENSLITKTHHPRPDTVLIHNEQSLITSNKNKNHKKIEKYRQTMYREKTRNRNTWKKETKAKTKPQNKATGKSRPQSMVAEKRCKRWQWTWMEPKSQVEECESMWILQETVDPNDIGS